jgi:hypothetical protein
MPPEHVIVPSSVAINCDTWPITCNPMDPCSNYCFDLSGFTISARTEKRDIEACAVLIHPKITFKKAGSSTDPLPSQYFMAGITALTYDKLEDQIRGHATAAESVLPATPADGYYVQYTLNGKSRTVALYAISHPNNACVLRIGQEVSNLPTGINAAMGTATSPDSTNLPYYHQVTNPADNMVYHVAVAHP